MSAAAPKIAESSNKLYTSCIKIMKDAGLSVMNPAETIKWINETKKSESTRKSYLCSAIHEIKQMTPTDATRAAHEEYRKIVHDYSMRLSEKMKDQKLSEAESKKFVDWKTIVASTQKLYDDKSALMEHKLLAAFYTMIPPVRADLGNLQIYKKDPMLTTENYVVVRNKDAFLKINNYKNDKIYGALVSPIPKQLVSMIRAHLKKNPTALKLFPYNDKELSRQVINLFTCLTGKAVGISMLRHSYITDFLSKAPSFRDAEELAKRMGHSVAIQTFYRRLEEKGGSKDESSSDSDASTTDSDSE